MLKITSELQLIKKAYDSNINLVEGLPFRQKDTIKMIEYYSASRYLGPVSGGNAQRDELGREKPFYNILNGMCDVENAAKDIDTKDISVTSDDGQHYTESFLMTKDIYEWMKEINFAKTLNDMRDTHTKYGSLLVKKCTSYTDDGEKTLRIEIPEWKNVITDQVNIKTGAVVEVHYKLPSELLAMEEWDQEAISGIVEKASKEGAGKRVPVYEIRGNFPKSFIKDIEGKKPTKKDEKTFSYQLYYLAGEYTNREQVPATSSLDFSSKLTPLYWEDDTDKVYKYLARKPKAGRAFGIGVMEEGSESQVWTNDAVLKQQRAMEYTTKVIGQSASKKLRGRNMLTEVDDGQILEHEDGKPVTPLNLLPAGGLGQYEMLINQWFSQLERTTSGFRAQRGEEPPSGTPFRLQAMVLQQSNSVFQDLQEELGIFITELFTDWVMPYLAKKLNQEHILSHEFAIEELKEIDGNFARYQANEMTKEAILAGQVVSPEQYAGFMEQASQAIKQTKGQRFLKVPKDYYKKFKAKITVNVTGEQRNKAATLESLLNIMTVYAKNPSIAQDPVLMQIFLRIVELSGAGISPVQLVTAMQEQAKMIAQQQQAAAKSSVKTPSESISFKDLPPEGQAQMAEQAGIKIAPPSAKLSLTATAENA